MELNWFIIYLFLWFYLRINSLWAALTALRRALHEFYFAIKSMKFCGESFFSF
jgi:hypothetical protein